MLFLHILECACVFDISADRNVWPQSALRSLRLQRNVRFCDRLRLLAISDRLLSYGNQAEYPKFQSLLDSQSTREPCCTKYAEHFMGGNKYPIPPCALVSNTDTTLCTPFAKVELNPHANLPIFIFSLFTRGLLGYLIIITSNSFPYMYSRLKSYGLYLSNIFDEGINISTFLVLSLIS